MNFLGHLYVSGAQLDWQLGGFLGDFVKGPLQSSQHEHYENWSDGVIEGIKLHRLLDQQVDALPELQDVKKYLSAAEKRVGGIVTDLLLDHFLSRHWGDYCTMPLDAFTARFYHFGTEHYSVLPPSAQSFLSHASRNDLLASYGSRDRVIDVLGSIERRFRHPLPVVSAGHQLFAVLDEVESTFPAVFDRTIEMALDAYPDRIDQSLWVARA